MTATDILNVVRANGAAVLAAVPHGDRDDPANTDRYDVVIRHHNPDTLPAVRADLEQLLRAHGAPNYVRCQGGFRDRAVPVLVVEAVTLTPDEAREIAA